MKKTKDKKSDDKKKEKKVSFGRVISDNLFILRLTQKAEPKYIFFELFFTLVSSAVGFISNAYLLRFAINGIEEGLEFWDIAVYLIGFGIIQLGYYMIAQFYYRRYRDIYVNNVGRAFAQKTFKQAVAVELGCYEDPEFYDKFAKAIEESGTRAVQVVNSLSNIVGVFFYSAANIWLLIDIDPWLMVFVFIPMLALPIASKTNKLWHKRWEEMAEENRRNDYSRRTFYLTDYAKEMRLSDMPQLMLDRFADSAKRIDKLIGKYGIMLGLLYFLHEMLNSVIVTLGATAYCLWQTLGTGNMKIGDCLVVINSIENISYTISYSIQDIMRFHENALYIENLREFLDYEPKLVGGEHPMVDGGDLVLENVSFKYEGADNYSLKNVSMRFGKNEKIAVVGHNGAGKSTLVKLLLRLYDGEGSISYGGVDIREFDLGEYRDIFASVMQDVHVFAMSISDNVILRKRREGDGELVRDALFRAGLSEKIDALEKKEQTVMTREFDESGEIFSGGEAQKLAISHIYSKQNRFVILDEPSSALDPIAEHDMYEKMGEACRDCGMIFISHRLSSAVSADRIYLLEGGELAECGTHAELMAKNGIYADMFRKQAENYIAEEVGA